MNYHQAFVVTQRSLVARGGTASMDAHGSVWNAIYQMAFKLQLKEMNGFKWQLIAIH